jgi:RNA polymerase sigma-70 factor (ECF subfamily)
MKNLSQITPDEDAPLLLSWYRGDPVAFETLVWKYQKRIFNLALLLTGEQKTACKVTENSFIAAYQNIRSLKSTTRFSAWLVSLALKECKEINDYKDEEPDSSEEPEPDLDDESSYAAAIRKKLELCIRELPFELSELILLRYVRGYSLERVAEILQISGDMLLSRLFKAQETLACWLKSDTEDPAELAALKTDENPLHPEIRRNFSAYLDNSIENDEKELTKAHLKSCGSCREALSVLEWMVEDIKSIQDVEPPQWLASSIIQKVRNFPEKPEKIKSPSPPNIQIVAAAILMAFISGSAYLFLNRSGNEPELPGSGTTSSNLPVVEKKADSSGTGFTSVFKGLFSRGAVTTPDSLPKAEKAAIPSVPLPSALPPEPSYQAVPVQVPVQPATETNSDQIQKKERSPVLPPALQEWGDPVPQSRSPQKKAPVSKTRAGEVAVVLSSADPVAAAHDIESAVTAIGGRINGRSYSDGTDVMYTRVEVDRFFDLMSRLGKIGNIQELPQLPEGAEGVVDLVIKW